MRGWQGVSNHRQVDCLFTRLRTQKTSMLRIIGRFVIGNHKCSVDSPLKGPVKQKLFSWHDAIKARLQFISFFYFRTDHVVATESRKTWLPHRYRLFILLFFATTIHQAARTNFNLALVVMVKQTAPVHVTNSSDADKCPGSGNLSDTHQVRPDNDGEIILTCALFDSIRHIKVTS